MARAPSAERRRARVDAGVIELLVWLRDQVDGGLARVQADAYRRFDTMAARLVDAQAPGLAGRVRSLPGVTASGPGWNERLLTELAQLYALARAHQRLDELPAPLAETVRTHVGYPVPKERARRSPPVHDAWFVLGRKEELDGVLQARRSWLLGGHTGRVALVLTFAPRGQRLDDGLRVGTLVLADLHFYPGSLPLRALVGQRYGELDPQDAGGAAPPGFRTPPPPPAADPPAVRRRWAQCLARDPWLRRWPVVVTAAPAWAGDRAVLTGGCGAKGSELALNATPDLPSLWWTALALGGGGPVTWTGEYGPDGLAPLSVWADAALVPA